MNSVFFARGGWAGARRSVGVGGLPSQTYSCREYGVTEHEVLRPGFVLWFTGCIDQRAWRDGEYIFAKLNNMQIGSGRRQRSGGTYRSKNAMEWGKQTQKGWLPVAEAQQ